MKYVKAYLESSGRAIYHLGAIYVVASAIFDENAITAYVVFLSLMTGVAGPIGVYLKDRKV